MVVIAKRLVYDFTVETSVPPESVLAAATDFTDRRPDLWPLITRKNYRVYSTGDGTAEVDEGSAPAHHRIRYEWSGDTVRGVTIDASGVEPGSLWQLRARPREGGGSTIDVHMDFGFKGPMGLMARVMVALRGREGTFRKWFLQTVDVLERDSAAPRPGAQ